MGQLVQTEEEVDRCMSMTDPKLFSFSPDTAHLYLAGIDPVQCLDRHKSRLMLLDYKDARRISDKAAGQYLRPGRRRNRLPWLPSHPEIDRLPRLDLRGPRYRPPRTARELRALRRLRGRETGTDLCLTAWSRAAFCLEPWPSSALPPTIASSILTFTSGSTIPSFRSPRAPMCPSAMPRPKLCSA